MIFSQSGTIRPPEDIREVIQERFSEVDLITTPKKEQYYNCPCAFDIETSSFSVETEKCACCYGWTLGLNGEIILGRTWEEFATCIQELVDMLGLGQYKRLIIYVHNLAYEFQFLAKRFLWENVFALRERKPVYARTFDGIEFRCSYLLSGYSLAQLGKHLTRYKVEKAEGDLDYDKMRHSKTPLTVAEKHYMENDSRVVMAYIQERIEDDGDITLLPLTKTGYVRTYCRKACLYGEGSRKSPESKNKYYRYRDKMRNLIIDPDEYAQLKRAFQGGFTHASAWKSGKCLQDVSSFDFTSSYPAVMVSEKFPMSRGELVEITSTEQFKDMLSKYCCLFDVEFFGLVEKEIIEHPLSISRCRQVENEVEDNGRVVKADHLITTLTEQDYFILEQFYDWEEMRVGNFRRYRRTYLPSDFVKAILDLYQDKTELKGVEGREIDYARAKEMINSCYGMTVTDICREEITYTDEWKSEKPDVEGALDKYNKSKNRFLFYAWGVWVTAYARKNLFTGIKEFGPDYVYSDTDSIKVLNADKHKRYIEGYNANITGKLKRAMEYHGFPFERTRPRTKDGIEKPLGVWDYEGKSDIFKTLGSKRYLVYKGGKLLMTVSGLNKKVATPYLLDLANGDIQKAFDLFSDNLYIPPGKTGKNVHTYIDEERHGILVDYLGQPGEYQEFSCIHLEPAEYSLSLSTAYANFLKGLKTQFD